MSCYMKRPNPSEVVLEQQSETACIDLSGFESEVLDTGQKTTKYQRNVVHEKSSTGRLHTIVQRSKKLCSWNIPWIIILLSTVKVVVYLVACDDSMALLTFKRNEMHEIWRLFTYHTIHFNFTHLLLNVVLQILFAFPLETEQGHCRVFVVYIVGIVCGAIGSVSFESAQTVIGSSAGVYSLLFSHISQCFLSWTTISFPNLRLIAVLMLFCGDLSFSLLKSFFWNDIAPKISLSAHIFGGISGFLTGLVIFRRLNHNLQNTSSEYRN